MMQKLGFHLKQIKHQFNTKVGLMRHFHTLVLELTPMISIPVNEMLVIFIFCLMRQFQQEQKLLCLFL